MDKTFEKIYEEYNKESAMDGNQALFEKVYAEAEMLNEMNPKLKALLAAGLIGTAGLGMQSCSNPSDSVYYPYTVEAPSTDNPGSGGETVNPGDGGDAETSNPSSDEENGGNGGETKVTFRDLGVYETDAARIANATETISTEDQGSDIVNVYGRLKPKVYVYTGSKFEDMTPSVEAALANKTSSLGDWISERFANSNAIGYLYIDEDASVYMYFIPKDLEDSFKDAIDAYNKASQSNQ